MGKTSLVVISIALIVALVALGGWYWSLQDGQVVRVTQVQMQDLHSSIKTNGKAEAERVYEIRSPLSGLCREIHVREGYQVKEGQPLLTLDDAGLRSELASAQAELQAAEVDLRNVRRGPLPEELDRGKAEVERQRSEVESLQKTVDANEWLLQRNAISRYEVEESRRALARARQGYEAATTQLSDLSGRYDDYDRRRAASRLEAATTRIQFLQSSLSRTTVRAPATGTLYHFEIKNGAYLTTGDLVGYLADLKKTRIRAFVDEPELGRISVGAGVIIHWDGQTQTTWQGIVTHIPSQVVARGARSVAEVLCGLTESQPSLLPNVNVDVEIVTAEGPLVASLPRSCVFPEGKDHFVWVIRDGRAMKHMVQTGRSSPTAIEITGGIAVGDRVIMPGEAALSDGMKVRVSG